MGTCLNPGNKGFQEILQSEYVDKTGLIELINATVGTMEKLICAILQMKERNYPAVLEEYGGEIVMVGINYDAEKKVHSCVIEKQEKQSGVEACVL